MHTSHHQISTSGQSTRLAVINHLHNIALSYFVAQVRSQAKAIDLYLAKTSAVLGEHGHDSPLAPAYTRKVTHVFVRSLNSIDEVGLCGLGMQHD